MRVRPVTLPTVIFQARRTPLLVSRERLRRKQKCTIPHCLWLSCKQNVRHHAAIDVVNSRCSSTPEVFGSVLQTAQPQAKVFDSALPIALS